MGTRNAEVRVYATDGSPFTAAWTGTMKRKVVGSAAATVTPTHIADGVWSTTVDDTVDAMLYWSGTGITADHTTYLRIPTDKLANLGSGSVTHTYTLTRSDTGAAIADCEVFVTSDAGGTVAVALGYTNASGVVVFHLDPGTYYFWRNKVGYTFTDPDTETVTA